VTVPHQSSGQARPDAQDPSGDEPNRRFRRPGQQDSGAERQLGEGGESPRDIEIHRRIPLQRFIHGAGVVENGQQVVDRLRLYIPHVPGVSHFLENDLYQSLFNYPAASG
jgi:hypothetical protein